MKKWIIMIGMVVIISLAMISLAQENEKLYEITYEGDTFELILEENPSTAYQWFYQVSDENQVKLLSDESEVINSNLIGLPSKRVLKFQVLKEGIYTISLKKVRSFEENSAIETLDLVIFKNDKSFIVEENQTYTIMDQTIGKYKVVINEVVLDLDVEIMVIEEVTMVPLALPLRALGYEVIWHGDRETVEIKKGNQWTEIKIGDNAYFKNKMALRSLSKAPIIIEGRTLVPVEFFKEILNLSFTVENKQLIFIERLMASYTGTIEAIDLDEEGQGQITILLGKDDVSDHFLNDQIVLNVSKENTFIQQTLKVGDYISAYTSLIQTKSLPPQTPAYLIFKNNTNQF
jgi:predicted secreted protein